MLGPFETKQIARETVWEALSTQKLARFPFPPQGRIPNFKDAKLAAENLSKHPWFVEAKTLKVNPDAPQRFVRLIALNEGKTLFVPTARLRAGFLKLDPNKIPKEHRVKAASLNGATRWGAKVSVHEIPRVDLIITGSVAVTEQGYRCGKGHGYGDIEYAILRELGHPPTRVATTVHGCQVVVNFPRDPHDLAVHLIVTPEKCHEVENPPPSPTGIDWEQLPKDALTEMPILQELKAHLNTPA